MFEPPRATRDILPDQAAVRNRVRNAFVRAAEAYGFQEIQTPAFERLELFSARSGPEIKSSMLTFHCDHEEFALRPEITAPVCRLMSSGAFDGVEKPHKLYYVGSCFRYCRPQPGRYREFTQAGVECVGASGPAVDAEIIALACRVLGAIGVPKFALKIGNIGIFRDLLPENLSPEDRSVVIGHLDRLISIDERCRPLPSGPDESALHDLKLDDLKLDDLKLDRMELAKLQAETDYEGPEAIHDRPHLAAQEYAERLPIEAEATFRHLWQAEDLVPADTAELLLQASRLRGPLDVVREQARELLADTRAMPAFDELMEVCRHVDMYGVGEFEVVLGIARGFTFYTSTVFEISSAPGDGGRKYCGGGRYDRLVELFGGPPMPSSGCSFRFDDLVESFLTENDWSAPRPYQLFLLADSEKTLEAAVGVAEKLRTGGTRVGLAAGAPDHVSQADLDQRKTERIGLITAAGLERGVVLISDGTTLEEQSLESYLEPRP